MAKTVKAVVVTDRGRLPAMLSADLESGDGLVTLVVEGVTYAPDDLPEGAYLSVDEPEMADQAAVAGFALEPSDTPRRRAYRILGKLIGVCLVLGAAAGLFWAVQRALVLNLLGALVAVGVSLFLGLLGLFWWSSGGDEMLQDEAANRLRARRIRGRLRSFARRKS